MTAARSVAEAMREGHGRSRLHQRECGRFLRLRSCNGWPFPRSPPTRDTAAMSAGQRNGSPSTSAGPGFPVAEVWETGADGDRPARGVRRMAGRRSVSARRCSSTATTTCSRSSRSRMGHRRRSSRCSGTGSCWAAAPPTTRARCSSTPSACGPAWPRRRRGAPPVTLKLLIEGEEESGSPHFAALLEAHRDRLGCDVVVVTDTAMWAADTPTMCTGMRGITDCQLDLHGPERDLHSGSFGGAVPNPLHVMADLLAGLHDDDGRVTVPGLLRRVLPLSDGRTRAVRPAALRREGLARRGRPQPRGGRRGRVTAPWSGSGPGRPPRSTGCGAGTPGPAARRSCPADAHAKLSFRLVADQDPADVAAALREYVAQPHARRDRGDGHFDGPGVRPCFTPLDHPAVAAAGRAHGAGVRHGGAVHPGGRQRPGGGPGRRSSARRWSSSASALTGPDPRAERAGRDRAAAQGRGGRRVSVGRARSGGRRPDGGR